MSIKLFTIGDSLSQGVMSGAAARTDLCYSTRIAQLWRLRNYRFPTWPVNGLPINLEAILRHLVHHFGADISGLDWLSVLQRIDEVLDPTENYYERGPGQEPYPQGIQSFHNISVPGFYVADSWQLTPAICKRKLMGKRIKNQFLGVPEASFYRVATTLLNPSQNSLFDEFSQLEWLRYHCQHEGVANTIVWLGSNNALGSVLKLKIETSADIPGKSFGEIPPETRRNWNLWMPDHFRHDYARMLAGIVSAMLQNRDPGWRVFVGNIPHVTIAPLVKGVGKKVNLGDRGWYYEYYTYFPFGVAFAKKSGRYLNLCQALFIDEVVDQYNHFIASLIVETNLNLEKQGHPKRFFLVDLAKVLDGLAWKRNNGKPTYAFPAFFQGLEPMVNSLYYHADRLGQRQQGGLFSLDGVHPSAILQGLIAHEFLSVMNCAGICAASNYAETTLPWSEIFASDSLFSDPIILMQELYEHERLATMFVQGCNFLNWGNYSRDRCWF